MNITIINGANQDEKWSAHEKALEALSNQLRAQHNVSYFTIKDMNLNACTGCWDCWVKTPGLCRHKDDSDKYLSAHANADMVLYASPITAGFITSETKKALDRMIPTSLPYIRLHQSECHHTGRYKDKSVAGLLLFDDDGNDPEAIDIIFENFDRIAKNMLNPKLIKTIFNPEKMEVLYNEINSY